LYHLVSSGTDFDYLLELAQEDAQNRYKLYEHMASMPGDTAGQEVK